MRFSEDDAARVRAAAGAAMADLRLPGFAVGVVCGEALVFAEGFGFADIESGRRQDPALRQRIGSITKTMAGLCAMALADEGRLSLSDRLIDHTPQVILHGDRGAGPVRHLLTPTSGLGAGARPDQA